MFLKIFFLCSAKQRKSYRFGTTWGWVNDDSIFGWTIPLTSTHHHCRCCHCNNLDHWIYDDRLQICCFEQVQLDILCEERARERNLWHVKLHKRSKICFSTSIDPQNSEGHLKSDWRGIDIKIQRLYQRTNISKMLCYHILLWPSEQKSFRFKIDLLSVFKLGLFKIK